MYPIKSISSSSSTATEVKSSKPLNRRALARGRIMGISEQPARGASLAKVKVKRSDNKLSRVHTLQNRLLPRRFVVFFFFHLRAAAAAAAAAQRVLSRGVMYGKESLINFDFLNI